MPLFIVRNDITKMRVDAIVNAANSSLLGGGGVDGAIHRAAGPGLLAECRGLGGCETGEAKATGAYELPAKYVIHTVGPVWRGGGHGERGLLESCYKNSLEIADKLGCESVAFPLISSGVYGYPKEQAFRVAADTIEEHLLTSELTVYLVVFDRDSYSIGAAHSAGLRSFISENYVADHSDAEYVFSERQKAAQIYAAQSLPEGKRPRNRRKAKLSALNTQGSMPAWESAPCRPDFTEASIPFSDNSLADAMPCGEEGKADLDRLLNTLDESFSQMLLRKIDERGMTDAECYKRANIDRKLFSKIRINKNYSPSKPTALAFAIALELPIDEARELLMKAGYALSRSSKFDVILEYFISNRNYDIYEINETLFAFDLPLLG